MSGAQSPTGEKPQTGSDPIFEQATAAAPSTAGGDNPAASSAAARGFNFADSARPPVFGGGNNTAGQAKPPVVKAPSVLKNMNAKKTQQGYKYTPPTIPGPTEAQKAELAAKRAGLPTPAPPAPTPLQLAMQVANDAFASYLKNQADPESKLRISTQRIAELEATVARDYETIAASEQKFAELEKEHSEQSKHFELIKRQHLEKTIELGKKLHELHPLTQIKNQFEYIKPKYDELKDEYAGSQAELKLLQQQHSARGNIIRQHEKDVADKDALITKLQETVAARDATIIGLNELVDEFKGVEEESEKMALDCMAMEEKINAAQAGLEEIFSELGKGLDLPAFLPHIRELKEGATPPPRPILTPRPRPRPGRIAGFRLMPSAAPSTTGAATATPSAALPAVGSAPTAVVAAEAEGSAPKSPVGPVGGASATEEVASAPPAAEPVSSTAVSGLEMVPFTGRRLAAPEPDPLAWVSRRPRAPRPALPALRFPETKRLPMLPWITTTDCAVQTSPAETRAVGVQTSERSKVVGMIPVRSGAGSLRRLRLPSWQQLLLLLLAIIVGWFAYTTISSHLAWSYANDVSWMDPSPSWAADSRVMLALCQNIEWLIGYEHIVLA